jgi:F-type H+-transporting ATPase subunit b
MSVIRKSRAAWLGLGLCLALLAGYSIISKAQESSQSAPSSAQPQQEHRAVGPGEQLAEESRAAAGEDTQEHLKKSPSVQFISRLTGLSVRGAFWLGQLINFGVIALAIVGLSKKNLPGLFRGRTVSIKAAMEEARRASEDANRRLGEIEARLAHLDSEIGAMQASAEKEAAAEEERIKQAAEEDVHKITESATQEITAAAKAARRELTAYAADLAVSLAKKQIHVDSGTDEVLVRSFASQLNQSANGSGKDVR